MNIPAMSYEPRSATVGVGISASFFSILVKTDLAMPVIVGREEDCVQHAAVAGVVG